MRIYIAGPITGLVYEDALRAFAMAEASLRRDGHEPVNPMAIEPTPDLPWAEYMRQDIPQLLSCEAIYLLEGWENSKGARLEKHIAEQLGMTILFAAADPVPVCQSCGIVLIQDVSGGVYRCGECVRKLATNFTNFTNDETAIVAGSVF